MCACVCVCVSLCVFVRALVTRITSCVTRMQLLQKRAQGLLACAMESLGSVSADNVRVVLVVIVIVIVTAVAMVIIFWSSNAFNSPLPPLPGCSV